MQVQDILHGFRVTERRELPELSAVLWRMEYEKNGAELLFLDREDDNKTFAIAFKTIPEDDTGVFHIIEHSVLCGSDKFPVKEPFVELLKGSMQTFLNAMTFPDKTVYPVSSQNNKDFYNLVDVYMDAVLHPAILKNPMIFRQEGWHPELSSAEGELTCQGVVLNEMKGAYSSVDEVIDEEIARLLFPDNCYGKDSGGEPSAITTLSYERFLYFHKKYYHPSNARILLDGSVDLEEILPLLDAYLSDYERAEIDTEIAEQAPVSPAPVKKYYEISPEEDAAGKVRVALGFGSYRYDEREKQIALSVLLDLLCGSNEAPLKKTLLSEGLCEDIILHPYDGIYRSMLILELRNTEEEKVPALLSAFSRVIAEMTEGLDRAHLTASLNNLEFRLRERDFGTTPRGLVYALSMLETWLYGGDPAQNLLFDDAMAFLRREAENGYFERLLAETLKDNPHRATLILLPSATLGEERSAAEKRRMEEWKRSLGEAGVREILRQNEELKAWQSTPDTKEALATIPSLSLSDISPLPEKLPTEEGEIGGVPLLYHDIPTDGIAYLDLYFNVNDLTRTELSLLPLLASCLGHLETESYSTLALQDELKTELGAVSATAVAYELSQSNEETKLFFRISVSALETRKARITPLLTELLYRTRYRDTEAIRRLLRQMKLSAEDAFVSSGHTAGIARIEGQLTAAGAASEVLSGYESYLFLKEEDKDFDARAEAISEDLLAICKKIFTKERLVIGHTGKRDDAFLTDLVSSLASDGVTPPAAVPFPTLPAQKEGIAVPTQVSFAEAGALLPVPFCGQMYVARQILSLEYLWNSIRVRGGAYGAGASIRKNGMLLFYSYRDPNPARSITHYREVGAFLRDFAKETPDLTKYVIGAVAALDSLLSPSVKGLVATAEHIKGITYEEKARTRREMLATDAESLLSIATALDAVADALRLCVIGSEEALSACALDKTFSL